ADPGRAAGHRNDGYIEQLNHFVAEPHPFDDIATAEIDDHEAAPRRSLAPGQFVVERQSLEPAVAWQRQGDDRVATNESQPARQAPAEADVLPTSRLSTHPAHTTAT